MASRTEPDLSLRRVERDAVLACAGMAALALVLQRGAIGGALGVVGGGALMAFSFRAIRGGVDAMVGRVVPAQGDAHARLQAGRIGWAILRFVFRYAIIGVAAWVLLAKLRAHPIGLIAGVTAPVVALAAEAVRLQRRPPGPPPVTGDTSGSP
jgi:hypothetical protein